MKMFCPKKVFRWSLFRKLLLFKLKIETNILIRYASMLCVTIMSFDSWKNKCRKNKFVKFPRMNILVNKKNNQTRKKYICKLENLLNKVLIQYKNLSNYAKDHVRLWFSSILNSKIFFSAEANQTHYILLLFMV